MPSIGFGEPLVDECVGGFRIGCEVGELPHAVLVDGDAGGAVLVGVGSGVDAVAGAEGFAVGVVHAGRLPAGRWGS